MHVADGGAGTAWNFRFGCGQLLRKHVPGLHGADDGTVNIAFYPIVRHMLRYNVLRMHVIDYGACIACDYTGIHMLYQYV